MFFFLPRTLLGVLHLLFLEKRKTEVLGRKILLGRVLLSCLAWVLLMNTLALPFQNGCIRDTTETTLGIFFFKVIFPSDYVLLTFLFYFSFYRLPFTPKMDQISNPFRFGPLCISNKSFFLQLYSSRFELSCEVILKKIISKFENF